MSGLYAGSLYLKELLPISLVSGEFNDLKAVSEVFHGDNSVLFFDKKMGQPSYSAMRLTGKSVELHKMCC